ncbi:LOW QUALITY PROTEIN: hypothetical protein HID58_086524 [Brassica napus]|uniref:Uncharacterized protein n=1 Tax=Brassica napus TaxID=3708 RepID=A0ABQ7XQP5_BRANA|nr:LOW QUALITY PROTEIN: hypothetical protein HID58_086524 [Brassica napus]
MTRIPVFSKLLSTSDVVSESSPSDWHVLTKRLSGLEMKTNVNLQVYSPSFSLCTLLLLETEKRSLWTREMNCLYPYVILHI